MIYSMTAFANEECASPWGVLSWELRSVNHRYAEVSIRLPEVLRSLEQHVRDLVAARVKRGKVDVVCRLREQEGQKSELVLDQQRIMSVLKACTVIEQNMDNPARISALDILGWQGVIDSDKHIDIDAMSTLFGESLARALDVLVQNRQREGEKIGQLIDMRCQAIAEHVASLRAILPAIQDAQRQKLLKRFDELKLEVDAQRLEQELVYLAQKSDVEEELDRLEVHVTECRQVLAQQQPVGRRLDFLMQEFNREINTLSSKSVSSEMTKLAVDMKVIVEQMREQIQNVE